MLSEQGKDLFHQHCKTERINFYERSVGQIRPVLVEKSKNGILFGYTDNYIKTRIQGHTSLENTIQNVFISEAKLGYVESEVVSIN